MILSTCTSTSPVGIDYKMEHTKDIEAFWSCLIAICSLNMVVITYKVLQIVWTSLHLPNNCNVAVDWHIEESLTHIDILNRNRIEKDM